MRFFPLLWGARPGEILPDVEVYQHPSPSPTGLFPINQPRKHSPVLLSGNSKLTVEVLTAVLSTTASPFWYLVVDTDGHTVDMAMVYNAFTAERAAKSVLQNGLNQTAPEAELFLPGFAAPIKEELAEITHRPVTIGPICAAEMPLFFGKRNSWQVA
jgi:CO dehydrogenase/acetyl-CoA synthase gamma subunit (corrinoid Fe-S protein)